MVELSLQKERNRFHVVILNPESQRAEEYT